MSKVGKVKLEIGTKVQYNSEDDPIAIGGVVEIAKGWVTVMRQDGTTLKCRAKALTACVGGPEPIQVGDAEHPAHVTEEVEGVNFSDLDPEVLAAAMAEDEEDEESEDESGNPMANTIKKYKSRYKKMATPCGKSSINNGDAVAKLLAPLDYSDVMALADQFCELGSGFCEGKYRLLNNGQMRMNSGNRIRARVKKSPETILQLGEMIAVLFGVINPEGEQQESEEAEGASLTAEELAAGTLADEEHAAEQAA